MAALAVDSCDISGPLYRCCCNVCRLFCKAHRWINKVAINESNDKDNL